MVWCGYNEQTNLLHVYRCLLTNRLHGKAAELYLANRGNNRVTSTKYMSTIYSTSYSFYHMALVKFYCDGITRKLINTSINTFFRKLCAFLQNKEEGRPVMVKRKLHGAVDGFSRDRKFRKSDATVRNL